MLVFPRGAAYALPQLQKAGHDDLTNPNPNPNPNPSPSPNPNPDPNPNPNPNPSPIPILPTDNPNSGGLRRTLDASADRATVRTQLPGVCLQARA